MIVERSGLAEPSAGDGVSLAGGRRPTTERLASLRDALMRLEGAGGQLSTSMDASHISLGAGAADICLRRAALHEITAREAGDGAATLAFALALALRASFGKAGQARHGRMLIVLEDSANHESGLPYGHGLAGLGLDPDHILLVSPRRPVEALWAIEEGLRSGALAAVIGIFARLPHAYDLTASRRLVLAARDSGMPVILAITGEGGAGCRIASAAETRWQIASRPSARGLAGEPTNPAFTAELLRRRGGEPATFDLDWNHDARHFSSRSFTRDLTGSPGGPPLSQPLAAAPADRSGHAARAG